MQPHEPDGLMNCNGQAHGAVPCQFGLAGFTLLPCWPTIRRK